MSVKLNDVIGPYFQISKGVRHGDPISPFSNTVADYLTKMDLLAQEKWLVNMLESNLIPNGFDILQHADDTIMCFEDNCEYSFKLKLLLYLFEIMTGCKINFLNSEDFVVCELFQYMLRCLIAKYDLPLLNILAGL